MNLKKIILGIALIAFIALPTFAASSSNDSTKSMVAQYKAQNYLGCLQTSQRILEKNPSNIYAYYYQGLVYAKLGKGDKAIESFDKVESLNGNPVLVENAKKGKTCLTSPEECAKFNIVKDEFDLFIESNKFYDPKVQSEVNQKKLDRIKQDINEEVKHQTSAAPTNEEIANAVKTLAKVGFNPMGNMGMIQTPEMMQMNMLLGDSNSNNNNMLPYLLMGQNQTGNMKISPELVQTMMMSQMNLY